MDSGFGDKLRGARERRGLTVAAASELTKISRNVIESLEAEDCESFASPVYLRAFVRDYACFLGLDGQELLNDLPKVPTSGSPVTSPYSRSGRHLAIGAWVVTAALSLLAALAVVYFPSLNSHGPDRGPVSRIAIPMAADNSPTPLPDELPNEVGPSPPVPGDSIRLRIRVDGTVWVRIRSGRETILEETLVSGSIRHLQSPGPLSIRAGNAGAVWISVNGEAERSMGDRGKVAETLIGSSEV